MTSDTKELGTFMWRTTAVHMISYYIAGILAFLFLDYGSHFESGLTGLLMRSVDSPIIALGPVLQFVQGIVLALILFPFRGVILRRGSFSPPQFADDTHRF